ncbi:single-stranded DNA-binding protein [Ruficoccus amylovorans]|uniref:Single-stranded DNA-binding protein n=1 Tax=Ruficoccus amylovorans TaxID=1804625 RepID=A0A842H8W3_9BACT|nr:single-stranded DNA-binding protein [Ruficoccus amylovorans]
MASYNKVILLGNLTRDPEVRVTPGGMSICKFGLAVNRNFTTKDGEKREETTFVDIDAFGRQAEVIAKYLGKGRSIFVEGRLRLDQWDDKGSGEKRSKLGVVLENFQFVGGRDDAGAGGGNGGGYEQSSPPPRTTGRQSTPEPDVDEDVPF